MDWRPAKGDLIEVNVSISGQTKPRYFIVRRQLKSIPTKMLILWPLQSDTENFYVAMIDYSATLKKGTYYLVESLWKYAKKIA